LIFLQRNSFKLLFDFAKGLHLIICIYCLVLLSLSCTQFFADVNVHLFVL